MRRFYWLMEVMSFTVWLGWAILGYDLLVLKPTDPVAVQAAVERTAKAMFSYIDALKVSPVNCVWFFEGSIAKGRHQGAKASRNGRLSKLIRLMYRRKPRWKREAPMEALDHYLKNNPTWKYLRERLAPVRPRIGGRGCLNFYKLQGTYNLDCKYLNNNI
jgi:hypothetical protein